MARSFYPGDDVLTHLIMKIEEIKVLRGPNYWSVDEHKLIDMTIDLEELEDLPTNKIPGFGDALKGTLPSLQKHYCSNGHEGGFFERVEEGTWIGHVIEHIALEIQWLAGMIPAYGKTRGGSRPGQYHVIFEYEVEAAGVYAAEAAVEIVAKLLSKEEPEIKAVVKKLMTIRDRKGFGPTTNSILIEASKRGIPHYRINGGSLVILGMGIHQKKISASIASTTSAIGMDTAANKEETKFILRKYHIPVPKGEVVIDEKELKAALKEIEYPVAIKPVNGNHGRGVTTNITSENEAIEAFHKAQKISDEVIVERFIDGYDYRFLVINYKLVAVAKRIPAKVIGDGVSSLRALIDRVNEDPERGEDHSRPLTKIKIDDSTLSILKHKKLTLDSVIPLNETIFLKDTANLSSGGTSRDVTDKVHPQNVFMAERVAKILGLDICGIDIITSSVSVPITNKNGGVLEVNACPGFRMHLAPSQGLPRNVAEPVVKMLFPENSLSRIPIIGITGTNGKTTTTRLIAHLAKKTGRSVGYVTTDGIFVHDHLIYKGDCTGPVSAQTILTDPTVNFAVLECARGGILRSGLGFDRCDISIITNISSDHIGLDGINNIDDLVEVKSVLARSTKKDGYCILNADDDLTYNIRKELDCRIALFSLDPENERITGHCKNGGIAASVENGFVVVYNGDWKTIYNRIAKIPLTFGGKAECNIKNVLAAVLASVLSNFSQKEITSGLSSFTPSPQFTPGRFNIFNFKNFDLMLDYAHNVGSMQEVKKFLQHYSDSYKIGIVTGVGDRRDEDIEGVGAAAAEIFDEIIIRHDKEMRGRSEDSVTNLLTKGIKSISSSVPIYTVSDEREAILYAIESSKPRSFIVVFVEETEKSLEFVQRLKSHEEKSNSTFSKALEL